MPRDGNPTRERILRAAERLMTDQGYSATSVDQVIAAAASSKGAFFHHFSSKTDLAVHLMRRYVAGDLAQLDAGLTATAHLTDPAARVVAFLRYYEDGADHLMTEQSGCLYATVLAEREFTGSEMNDEIARTARTWRDAVAGLLRPALGGRRDIDVEALADHLYTTFEGGFILCRTYADPSAMRAQLRIHRQLVEALLGS
ncbi:TetR/AcrR family transcriptional regulator [Paractinoplanes durhamensis]|uniref:TetR family transcriptional regulator n=1 Tax=Paractinoplanes durhamensis TaxID=113563 RepID=A0ABQ3Z511_9ACTN|nr:TetR/AcrR family transcriptional regulator [Actinoplanes durhamensis]GIE04932.1 TetR family transcriptional regulator [Actinoplanes durhamensis]